MRDEFTALPTVKGGVTLPPKIRKKYNIGKNTPLIIRDAGNGVITIKVMQITEYNDIQFEETASSLRLTFPKGIDPAILIKKIKDIDG